MIGLAAVCPQVASVECARGSVVEGVLECTAAVPTCANAPVRFCGMSYGIRRIGAEEISPTD